MDFSLFTTVIDDTKKIGIGLTATGAFLTFLGILLFFDGGLLAIGNLLFISGIPLIIGVQRTLAFFSKREKLAGTACFFLGIILVLARWPRIGILVEAFGFINLFGNFFPIVLAFVRRLPYVSRVFNLPFVKKLEEKFMKKEEAPRPGGGLLQFTNLILISVGLSIYSVRDYFKAEEG